MARLAPWCAGFRGRIDTRKFRHDSSLLLDLADRVGERASVIKQFDDRDLPSDTGGELVRRHAVRLSIGRSGSGSTPALSAERCTASSARSWPTFSSISA